MIRSRLSLLKRRSQKKGTIQMTPQEWTLVLKKIAPKADPRFVKSFAACADEKFAQYGMTGTTEIAEFLGQVSHETAGFKEFTENMDYSAKRLMAVWPSRFKTLASASPYAHNPRDLANNVYANRMGNGPESSGDGYANRGGGLLHHTGKGEYDRVKKRTGHSQDTVRDASRADAMLDAGITYIIDRGVMPLLKAGRTDDATRKINGGLIGAPERRIAVARAKAVLAGQPMPKARMTFEKRDAAATTAKVASLSSTASVAAPVAAPKQEAGSSGSTMLIVGMVVAVAFAAVAALAWSRKNKIQSEMDAEKALKIELMGSAS
jgi:putative chitinase